MSDATKLKKAENIDVNYKDSYAAQLDAAIKNVGKDYSYDFNADQLYQDYKKTYMTEAQKAKANVIAAGKELTASRPDTYVESAANQQYQMYLADIGRLAPEFENLAWNRHLTDNADALSKVRTIGKLRDDEYGRYRDLLGDKRNYRDYLLGNYKYSLGYKNDKKATKNAKRAADQKYKLQKLADEVSALEAAKAAKGSKGRSGGRRGGKSGYGDYGYSDLNPDYDYIRDYVNPSIAELSNLNANTSGVWQALNLNAKEEYEKGNIDYETYKKALRLNKRAKQEGSFR